MKLNMDSQNNELRGMEKGLVGPEELTKKTSQLEELAAKKGDTAQYAPASGSF